jgi:hypothetical protein
MARTPMVWPPTTTSSRRSQCPRGQRPWHARKLRLLQKQSLGCHPIQGTIVGNHEERERRNCLLWKETEECRVLSYSLVITKPSGLPSVHGFRDEPCCRHHKFATFWPSFSLCAQYRKPSFSSLCAQ